MMNHRRSVLWLPPHRRAQRRQLPLVEVAVPGLAGRPGAGANHFLSLDPYMRGRMNDGKSYAQPQPLDATMIGGTVGEVVASKNPAFAVGDKVVGMGGWQEYSGGRRRQRRRAAQGGHHAHAAVGLPGRGGHARRHRLGMGLVTRSSSPRPARRWWSAPPAARWAAWWASWPRPAAAAWWALPAAPTSAPTWSMSWASTPASTTSSTPTSSRCRALKAACPDGIDGNFENVGGMILDAVMLRIQRLQPHRAVRHDRGLQRPADGRWPTPALILVNRMKLQGFIVSEHMELWPEALKELGTGWPRASSSTARAWPGHRQPRPRPSWAC
jgi:hypothetical protein